MDLKGYDENTKASTSSGVSGQHQMQEITIISTPPDGGYGWVVVFATFWLWFLYAAFVQIGIFMVEFSEYFEVSLTTFGWLNAIQTGPGRLLGIFLGPLVQTYGCRKVTIIGVLLVSAGFLASAFVPSVGLMYVTYGLLPGVGYSCIMSGAYVAPQQYFESKRPLACGLALCGLNVGFFAWPPLGTALINKLGYKFTLITEAAIIFVIGLVAGLSLCDPGKRTKVLKNQLKENQNNNSHGRSHPGNSKCWKGKQCKLSMWVDAKPLQNVLFDVFVLGAFFGNAGHVASAIYLPARSRLLGLSEDASALQASVMGISAGVFTFLFAAAANIPGANRPLMFSVGHMASGIMSLISTTFHSSLAIFLYAAITGIFHGAFFGTELPILVDLNGIELLPASSGWYIVHFGFIHLAIHPLVGWLLENTSNPHNSFYLAGGVQLFGGIILFLIPLVLWKKTRNSILPLSETKPKEPLPDTDLNGNYAE